MGLMPAEQAIICELLVRGPQTVGELRTRGERMHSFGDLAAVEEVLQELIQRENPLITLMARQQGRKEGRYSHLFSGMPPDTSLEKHVVTSRRRGGECCNDRIAKLEELLRCKKGASSDDGEFKNSLR